MTGRGDPLELARRIVTREGPDATAAVLGAGALGAASATADLDLVVVSPSRTEPLTKVFVAAGWPVELVVFDVATLRRRWAVDVRTRTLALLRVVAEGAAVIGDETAALQAEARALLAAGPRPLTATERDRRRFLVGDLLDDLVGTRSAAERVYVANDLLTHLSELALLGADRWIGGGKWLARELAAYDPTLADRLVAAHAAALAGDATPMTQAAREVLRPVGGPLPPGYAVSLRSASDAASM